MPTEYHDLSNWDIGFAALLIIVNGVISVALKLGLEKKLIVASIRTITQLSLLGFILEWIFQQNNWFYLFLIILFMTLTAGYTSSKNATRFYSGMWINSIFAVMVSSWLVTSIALLTVIRPETWKENPAQFVIPLLGMILGNTLNGISLGINYLNESLINNRGRVEMLLTLGATRWEAARVSVQSAVKSGMIPILNTMSVVGLVSLPGMMTGQILAGVPPLSAVKYQIVIMFLIASGTALGTIIAVVLGYRKLFNSDHQFLYERIQKR